MSPPISPRQPSSSTASVPPGPSSTQSSSMTAGSQTHTIQVYKSVRNPQTQKFEWVLLDEAPPVDQKEGRSPSQMSTTVNALLEKLKNENLLHGDKTSTIVL